MFTNRSLNFVNSKIEFIRVIKGTNFEFFSGQSKSDFFSKEFESYKTYW